MIGKITKGLNFRGVIDYLVRKGKGTILETSSTFDQPEEIGQMVEEFELTCSRNPNVDRVVTHISLSFAEEDGEIDEEVKIEIGRQVIDALGYSNCHYLMVAHDREDKAGHRSNHKHDHMHIALTSVDFDGKWVSDSWNFSKLEKVLRNVEEERGLRRVPCSWEKKKLDRVPAEVVLGQKMQGSQKNPNKELPLRENLQAAVTMAAGESRSVGEMAQRLAHQDIETRLNITRNGEVRGISYQMEGVKFQGSQLYDASAPKLESVHGIRKIKTDHESILNIKQGKDFLLTLPLPALAVSPQDDAELQMPIQILQTKSEPVIPVADSETQSLQGKVEEKKKAIKKTKKPKKRKRLGYGA